MELEFLIAKKYFPRAYSNHSVYPLRNMDCNIVLIIVRWDWAHRRWVGTFESLNESNAPKTTIEFAKLQIEYLDSKILIYLNDCDKDSWIYKQNIPHDISHLIQYFGIEDRPTLAWAQHREPNTISTNESLISLYIAWSNFVEIFKKEYQII